MQMSAAAHRPRAGILVTGTEVLTGIISDRNGPWLSKRLRDVGVDTAVIEIVGDRREDLRAALDAMAAQGLELIVTSGGLGPTADDLTAEVVGEFSWREMVLDVELEQRIAEILRPLMSRWPDLDPDAIRASNRKQAVIPAGATVLDPIGTAPGLVVPHTDPEGPTVVVLPGPPRELQPMWRMALETDALRAVLAHAPTYRRGILRLFGIPESEIANTLRAAESQGLELDALEITTCLRRGEIEISTLFEPASQPAYDELVAFVAERHSDTLFSRDGATIDDQVAELLEGRTVAVAESCTGGLMAARLTERPGSSGCFAGGVVAYSNAAKSELVGVDPALIERVGAVSTRSPRRSRTGRSSASPPMSGSASPGSPGPTAGQRKSRWGSCASRSRSAAVPESHAASSSPAAAPTSASARRRSRCTCSAACCSAWRAMSAERLRLFLALELPADAREELLRWRAPLARDLRPVTPDALHATLCFLGWRGADEVDAIAAACHRIAVHPAPHLTLGGGVWLPSHSPRVLAVELHGPLADVQASLSEALADGGWYRPEKRPYLAHVTVARVPKGARVRRSELPPPAPLRFTGSAITLFRSRLGPAGARYEPLHTVKLA